jgi:hypothetical protein
MPTGVYARKPFTNEHKEKLKKSCKKNKQTFKKGHIPWNKGLKTAKDKHYKCSYCGKDFIDNKHKNIKYCSRKCSSKSQVNKEIKSSTRNKISQALMKYYKTNTVSMKTRIKISNSLKGKKSYLWKDGRYPIVMVIRDVMKYKLWRKEVFERDNYTCYECGKMGVYLVAHHIKSFSKIMDDFLKKHSTLSPIKDRDVLIDLANKYDPFWDIDNGVTYCKNCHAKIEAKKRKRNKKGVFI